MRAQSTLEVLYSMQEILAEVGGMDIVSLQAAAGTHSKLLGLMLIKAYHEDHGQSQEICDLIHRAGGLVYCDGANMNALVGCARPGNMGFDVMHSNLLKTFSSPHGGGGPGSGPVGI